jgi:hypothetical protein
MSYLKAEGFTALGLFLLSGPGLDRKGVIASPATQSKIVDM